MLREPSRADAAGDRRAGDGRHLARSAAEPALPQPHHPDLPGVQPSSMAWRRRSSASSASSATPPKGLEERKQVLYLLGPVGGGKSSLGERLKALMEKRADLRAQGRDQLSPVFESPLGLFDPDTMAEALHDRYGIPRRVLTGIASPWALKRLDEWGGDLAALPRRQALPVAPQADRRRQDRARRRQQPGHLGPRRQGRHPQAGKLQPERPGRLRLLRRAEPRQPGHPRVRRDVQGADQDAAPAADRHAGGQLSRHREHRRHPVPGHPARPLQRGGVADLPQQPHQRGLSRPGERGQGAVLPPRDRGRPDLRQADQRLGPGGGALRTAHAGDAGALRRALAPQAARQLPPVRQDAGL